MGGVFGITFSELDQPALVRRLTEEAPPAGGGMAMVVTANTDHIINLLRNERFRRAYSTARLATADGAPVALYAKLRGAGLPGRVAGPDLFAALMQAMSPERHRPFFVASREATNKRLAEWLIERRGFAPESVGTVCPPFGFEKDPERSAELAWQVRAHGATHLFMGVGSPKSEVWLDDWSHALGDCYGLGIGAGLDYFVGTEDRAPRWMREHGLEWFWRLAREPRRLTRRYLVDALLFPVAVLRDATGHWQSVEAEAGGRDTP